MTTTGKIIIGSVLLTGLLYISANAVFALVNPQGWLRAAWTAKRQIHKAVPPWRDSDVRTSALIFVAAAILWGFIGTKLMERLLR